jgi:hypothetical protein
MAGIFDTIGNIGSAVGDALNVEQRDFTTTEQKKTAPIGPQGDKLLSGLTDFSGFQRGQAQQAGSNLSNLFGSEQAKNLFGSANTALQGSINPTGLSLNQAEQDLIQKSFGDSRSALQRTIDSAVGRFGSDASGTNLATNIGTAVSGNVSAEANAVLQANQQKKILALQQQEALARQQMAAQNARLQLAQLQAPGTQTFNTLADIASRNTTNTKVVPGPTPTQQLGTLLAGLGSFGQGFGFGGSGGTGAGGTGAGLLGGALGGLGGAAGAVEYLLGLDTPAGKQLKQTLGLGGASAAGISAYLRSLAPTALNKLIGAAKSFVSESDWDALESQFVTGADGQYDALEGGIFDDGGVTDSYESGGIDTTGMGFDFEPTTDSIFEDNSFLSNPDSFFDVTGGGDNLSFPDYYSPDLDMTGGMFDWGGEASGNPTEALSQTDWGW